MLWIACCLCCFGFLGAGEITVPSDTAYDRGEHLNVYDVSVDSISNPTTMKVKIKASKGSLSTGSRRVHRHNRKQALPCNGDDGILSQERTERRDAFSIRRQ